MLNGAIAGVAARTVSAPVDLLKIRFQLQSSTRQYSSVLGAVKDVLAKEGPTGFWKGNMAGIYLYTTYSAVQFGIYEKLKGQTEHSTFGPGIIGAIAAIGGTFVSYPFDLIRTRHTIQHTQMQAQKQYRTLLQTITTIVKEEGPASLYKGIGPSLAQVVPYMSLVFTTFEKSKHLLSPILPEHAANFASGMISGFLGKLIMMPVDVVRKRLQIQGSRYDRYILKDLPRYGGFKDCIKTIWKVEGIRGFFSGLSLALFKSVPATATTFVVYGFLKNHSI